MLPGWSSRLECDPGRGEQRMLMRNMTDPPVESDEKDGIACTEIEPSDLFRKAGSWRERAQTDALISELLVYALMQSLTTSHLRIIPQPKS